MKTHTADPVTNGWLEFADTNALLNHIISMKPVEQLVEVEEWHTKILCKALNAHARIQAQMIALNSATNRLDYRKCFDLIVINGSFNPLTNERIFSDEHKEMLMYEKDGGPVERLAMTILDLSNMLVKDTEQARKNSNGQDSTTSTDSQ